MKTIRRRRKENKTDYARRLRLLKSKLPRVIFRRTNKYVVAQYVETKEAKDKVIFNLNSKILLNHGWPNNFKNSLKSIPASYLLGFLVGKRITKDKLKTPIIDFGMLRMIHKTKVYAFLKGMVDSGIKLKYKKDIFPSEERLQGKNLKEDFSKYFDTIKSKIESI